MEEVSENAHLVAERKQFAARMGASRRAYDKVGPLIPGGVPGGLSCWPPYTHPTYLDRGEGCWVWDADGNQLLDLVAGDWIMLLGHGHRAVTEAIAAQMQRGTTLCSPDPDLGFEVATELHRRLPSMERMRFGNSGTEAVLHALRVARAATGRRNIAKMRGAYHGTYDPMLVANGKYDDPGYVPPGLAPGVIDSTVLLEYNDVDRCVATIRAEHRDLAAVIVEPIHATNGMVPATREFLTALRAETERYGIILVFDEVVTWPVAEHGAQGLFGVTPDLTTLGKVIGGGLPLSVFGGRRDLMDLVDPTLHGGAFASAPVRHAATTGGIAVCLAAAAAVLRELTPAVHARLTDLGASLRSGINQMAQRTGFPLQATGVGHLFGLHWTRTPVTDITSATTSNREMLHLANVFLYNAGYYMFQNSLGIVSTPMTPTLLQGFTDTWETTITDGQAAGWLVA